jgi:hypothetical protein
MSAAAHRESFRARLLFGRVTAPLTLAMTMDFIGCADVGDCVD